MKEKRKKLNLKMVGYKQLTVDIGAWDILSKAKQLAIDEGITHPSFSDAIRAMDKKLGDKHGK